jgi:hypothetical protein
MNIRKNARVNMIGAVQDCFEGETAVFIHAPALAEDLADLKAVTTELDAALEKAAIDTTDMTTAKNAFKATIVEVGRKVIGAASAYATQQGDNQLKNQLTNFDKQLVKATDNDLSIVCSNLITQVLTIPSEALAKRGITAADIPAFEQSYKTFKEKLPQNSTARTDVSAEYAKSEALTLKACAIIDARLAPTLFNIKNKVPDFYARFEKAATLKKPATTMTQLKLIVLDDTTGATLETPTITPIHQQALPEKAAPKRKSKINAKTVLKNEKKALTKADMLEITHEGYASFQMPMPKLLRGKITTLTVRLAPNAA